MLKGMKQMGFRKKGIKNGFKNGFTVLTGWFSWGPSKRMPLLG